MVNADKNVDRQAVNQIWTKSPGRLLMYLLVKGSGPNIVYTCSLFFFFLVFFFFFFFFFKKKKKKVQDMLTSGHDKMRILIVILNFGLASQKSDGFEVLDVLPRVPWI